MRTTLIGDEPALVIEGDRLRWRVPVYLLRLVSFRQIPIVTAREFLDRLEQETTPGNGETRA